MTRTASVEVAPARVTVRRRIRVLAPVVLVAAALLVTSCAAGQQAQTADEKPTLDGANANIGSIALRGLTIQAPPDGPFYTRGKSAQLRLVIANTGAKADQLTSISGPAIGSWSSYGSKDAASQVQAAGTATDTPGLPASSKSVTVNPGSRVSYGTPDASMSLLIMKLTQRLYPGNTIRLTFTFANAGTKVVAVPVALATDPNTTPIPGSSATGEQG